MKLGITSTPYLNKYGIAEGAAKMKKHGYSCIDYQGFVDIKGKMLSLSENERKAELTLMRMMVENEGLCFNQAHSPWRYPPRDLDPADRNEWLEAMIKSIRGSAYLGAKLFVVHPLMPFGANSAENPEEMKSINFEFFNTLAECGKEYDVTVCLENMPFPLLPITTVAQVLETVKAVNSDYFKVCLDTGHTLVCGSTLYDSVMLLGNEYLAALHVHDNDGTADRHLRPYEGIGDWRAFSDALEKIGFEGTFSLETDPLKGTDEVTQQENEITLATVGARLAKIIDEGEKLCQ